MSEKINETIELSFRNQRIEKEVIAYFLRKSVIYCSIIDVDWITTKMLKVILKIIQKKKSTFTKTSLVQQLKLSGEVTDDNKKMYISIIKDLYNIKVNHINSQSVQVMIDQLYELYGKRKCLLGISNIAKNIKKLDLDSIQFRLKGLSQQGRIRTSDKQGDYLESYEQRRQAIREKMQKLREEGVVGIPTGLKELDQHIGGLMNGEWGVIAGETGLGKTATMICYAIHAWLAGYNIVFASGEMSKEKIEFRIDSHITEIDGRKFRLGSLNKYDLRSWKAKIDVLRVSMDSYFETIGFTRGFTADEIEVEMQRIQERRKKPVHMIFCDYLNIMFPNNARRMSNKSFESQADVVWDFKALVEEFNNGICGWTANQIKDEFFGAEELTLDALKYARAISETAPIVCGLVRSADDILFNTLQMQILKMREAEPPKPILMYPNLNTMHINKQVNKVKSLLVDDSSSSLLSERKARKEQRRKRIR